MMTFTIDHKLLLRLAQDFAKRMANERETLQAAYLIGSVARQEPPLGNATDIDIVLIDEDPPEYWERYQRLSDTVLIDFYYTTPADYRDKQALRQHPFHGPNLYKAVSLYDPKHVFDLIQAGARSQIDKSENVYGRARAAYRWAVNGFESIQHYRFQPSDAPPTMSALSALHSTLEFGATAALLLHYKSHASRRHLATFEALTHQLALPALQSSLMQALGVQDLSDAEVLAIVEDWAQLYGAANRYNAMPTGEALAIHPARLLYYQRGFETLIEAGHARNCMLLLEQTLACCMEEIELYAPPDEAEIFREIYMAVLARTYKAEPANFSERVKLAGEFLQQIDGMLIEWARRENVTP